MKQQSAGLLMYRVRNNILEVLLAHPGGPFWKKKDAGAWTLPKGEIEEGDDPLKTAVREFEEEIGIQPKPPYHSLGAITQKAGKKVYAWAFQGDCDQGKVRSNLVEMEWPPRSGKKMKVPEIDRAEFFNIQEAKIKLNPAQVPFLAALPNIRAAAQR